MGLDLENSGYSEKLIVNSLGAQLLETKFEFNSTQLHSQKNSNSIHGKISHYDSHFPRVLGNLLSDIEGKKLNLKFTKGLLHAKKDYSDDGIIGVEVSLVLENGIDAKKKWTKIINFLSGMFCTSLNLIEDTYIRTINQSGDVEIKGLLPTENICTENLTNFLKLLKCKGKTGISTLLTNSNSINNIIFKRITISLENSETKLYLNQKVDFIFDLNSSGENIPRPIEAHDLKCKDNANSFTCFPLDEKGDVTIVNLNTLFKNDLYSKCPSTTEQQPEMLFQNIHQVKEHGYILNNQKSFSLIHDNRHEFELALSNNKEQNSEGNALFTIGKLLRASQNKLIINLKRTKTPVPNEVDEILIDYHEYLPNFINLFLHTLDISDKESKGITVKKLSDKDNHIHLQLGLDPRKVGDISLSFDLIFDRLLFIEKYPPDANHGFTVAPSLILTSFPNTSISVIRQNSNPLLVDLPTPDFSMPYNVIILSCTLMSLAFGNLFNLLVKRILSTEERDALILNGRLRQKVFKFLEKFGIKTNKHLEGNKKSN